MAPCEKEFNLFHTPDTRDGNQVDDVTLVDFAFVDAGLAASIIYDTRDNTIMPAAGYLIEPIRWLFG